MSDPAEKTPEKTRPPAPESEEAKKAKAAEAAKKAEAAKAPPPDGPVSAEEAAALFGLEPSEVFAAARRAGRVTAITVDARKLREGGEDV